MNNLRNVKLCENAIVTFYEAQKNIVEFNDEKMYDLIQKIINDFYNIGITFNEFEVEKIRREVYYRCQVKSNYDGAELMDDYQHEKWYDKLENKSTFFWDRYRTYLTDKMNFGVNIVNDLENDTLRSLMNFIGDPNAKENYLRRGLIIGDVQSGKTSTYTGLICKAADAGYKVIILLTGTIESLRVQTQERIEEGFVGANIASLNGTGGTDFRVGVGLDNKPINVTAFTSRDNDFTGETNKITSSIESNKIVLFVIKKNVTVLKRLTDYLLRLNAESDGKIHHPMLLIDDEADNASINTKKLEEDPTKTNKLIRNLIEIFTQSNYVGFTATPFANVFINPITTEEMENHDLFPQNFIFALPTPNNYIGATSIFCKGGKWTSSLIEIDDAGMEEDEGLSFFCKHKKDWHGTLPASLTDSVYAFLLANAIRDLRGDVNSHRSMLINLSRFVAVQWVIKNKVEKIFNNACEKIKFNLKKDGTGLEDATLNAIYKIWEQQFSQLEFTWVEIAEVLYQSISRIQIKVVNSGRKSEKLDYKGNELEGLRVIAIGGLALSRGLTLEGLLISYFFRNTATYDVLMQMGRWFGYRRNYEDVFRIWIGQKSKEWYSCIAEATELLKSDMRRMNDLKLTPKDFGIRVRRDSDELGITASNKMRAAVWKVERESYFGDIVQAPYLCDSKSINNQNLDEVQSFIKRVNEKQNLTAKREGGNGNRVMLHGVNKNIILSLVSKIRLHNANNQFVASEICKMLVTTSDSRLDCWDVAFIEGKSKIDYCVGNEKISPITRKFDINRAEKKLSVSLNGQLTGPADARQGLNGEKWKKVIVSAENDFKQDYFREKGVEFNKETIPAKTYFKYIKDRNPLLLIYVIELNPAIEDDNKVDVDKRVNFKNEYGEDLVVSFAMGLPYLENDQGRSYVYAVNPIYKSSEIDTEENEEVEE